MAKSMKLHSCYFYFRNMSHSRPFQTQSNGKATSEIASKHSHSDTVCHSQLQKGFCKKHCANLARDSTEPTDKSALPAASCCQQQAGILEEGIFLGCSWAMGTAAAKVLQGCADSHGESHVQGSLLLSDPPVWEAIWLCRHSLWLWPASWSKTGPLIFHSSCSSLSCGVWLASLLQPSAWSYPASWPFLSLCFPGHVPASPGRERTELPILSHSMHVLAFVFIQAEFSWKGSVQVIRPESAVWMSVPSSPFFTTPPALSPLQTSPAVILYFSEPTEVTRLSPLAKTVCLAFPLKTITVQCELNVNRITANKRSWKILPVEEG